MFYRDVSSLASTNLSFPGHKKTEGEYKMRKESIGRLLLTLLTAFVMVAGVFGAAVPTFLTESQTKEMGPQPSFEMAGSEFEEETRETGDAPVSALDIYSEDTFDNVEQWSAANKEIESDLPQVFQIETQNLHKLPEKQYTAIDIPLDHGTRATLVDAYGPYGEAPPGIPYIEGDAIEFEADIIGGSNDDYIFRWDVDNDGNFEGPGPAPNYWGAFGENTHTQDYRDNYAGKAKVEAWDTYSMKTLYGEGLPLEDTYYNYYWQWSNHDYLTWGWQFDISEQITVDELLLFRSSYPYQVYYIDIWDTKTQLQVATTGYMGVYPTTYSWNTYSITPVTIPAGNYIISAYVRTYYYYGYMPAVDVDPSDDLVSAGDVRYLDGSGYPTGSTPSGGIYPMVSFHYTYSYQIPDVLEDTADVFVDNSAPIALNPTAIGAPGQEGSSIGFTGSLLDAGLDDEWWYRFDFGDGSVSNWEHVRKWSGGATILLCTSWLDDEAAIASALDSALGNFDISIDIYDFYSSGAPDLDLLLEYDVVISGENTITTATVREEMGNVLADYSDQGGNVITMFASDGDDPYYGEIGITGRWREEQYNVFIPGELLLAGLSMGTVYDPSHPIMQGVSSVGFSANFLFPGYEVGTTPLADNSWGYPFAGYKDNPIGSGGRIVGIDMLPVSWSCSGDYMILFANAVKWASQQQDPHQIPMPIALEPIYHTYRDDHPVTLTPEDTFDVKVEIKDDDHGNYMIVGGVTTLMTQDFSSGSMPPPGWTRSDTWYMDWILNNYNNAGGVSPEAAFVYYNGYGSVGYGRLYSDPVDTTGFAQVEVSFKEYLSHFSGPYTLSVETSTDGVNWDTVWEVVNPGGWGARTTSFTATANIGSPTTYFSWTFYGDPWNLNYWYIDDIQVISYAVYGPMEGLGEAFTSVVIKNVFPEAVNKMGVVLDVDENTPMTFEGFEISDPARGSGTEEFWYRWDFDDGTPVGPWIYNQPGVSKFRVLLFHALSSSGESEAMAQQVVNTLNSLPMVESVTAFNFYEGGSYPAVPTLQEMIDNYDICMFGCCYNLYGDTSRETFGDNLADWMDITGGGFVSMMYTYGQAGTSNEQWTLLGRYIDDDYGPYEKATRLAGTLNLGNILEPSHPVMQGITDLGCGDRHDGMLALTPGGVKLAEWSDGTPAIGVKELPNGARSVHLSAGGYVTIQGDYDIFLGNALLWAGENIMGEPIHTVEHNFMDNGVYDVNLQIIDDDMLWDFSGGYPVFTGTPGTEEQWIGGTVFPVSVDNTDPVISPKIRAYAELDLSIRVTGQPMEDCEMRLYKGDTLLDSVTCHHDGNHQIEVMDGVTFEMTEINDYHVEVEYFGTGSGANPTWIFSGHFPSGKIKELKHEFKDGDPIWIIGPDMLKKMILGEDIIFEATAYDYGSDDLAFVWSFGDSTPFGVHIYANDDPDVFVGESDEATVIFDQDPDRDPWFDKPANNIRSPWGTDMSITDKISHSFDENQPYYFYIYLTVMDDDVGDDYPSIQVPHCTGCDIAYIEIDLS